MDFLKKGLEVIFKVNFAVTIFFYAIGYLLNLILKDLYLVVYIFSK